jgi:hypothetical protein
MARFKTQWGAIRRLPSGRPPLATGDEWRCIESQSGDDSKGVTVASVNRDPLTATPLAEATEVG